MISPDISRKIKYVTVVKLFFVIVLFLVLYSSSKAGDTLIIGKKPNIKKLTPDLGALSASIFNLKDDERYISNPAFLWLPLMRIIRDTAINRIEAVKRMNDVLSDINSYMTKKEFLPVEKSEWIFPVKGYTPAAIGGTNGSGYKVADFDFFNQATGGHPAHDIFILDRNEDILDDITGKPVEILSMSGGIVVETRKNWTPEMMEIKGGNIVYVYDNFTDGLFYYAHLDKVFVNVGDFVYPGKSLGIMGRTGKNAYPSRSPTHLHLMYVKNYKGDLKPADLYDDLVKSTPVK